LENSYGSLRTVVRRQVIVQLDDELVQALDDEADRLGVSRSDLLRKGARALLEVAAELRAERKHAEAYRRIPEDELETETFLRLAAETAPSW